MRTTSLLSSVCCWRYLLYLTALTLCPLVVVAQDATPVLDSPAGAAKLPKSPKDLMALAAKSNGLTGSDIQPWHLKASFTILDDQGNPSEKGTYEEYWASQHQYKIVYANGGYNQVEYGTDAGLKRSGANTLPPALFRRASSELTNPILVNDQLLEHWILDHEKRERGGVKLVCLHVKGWSTPNDSRAFDGPTYCLDADRPMLRFDTNPMDSSEWARSNFLNFQGHYIAGDVECIRQTKSLFRAHIDSIETLKAVNESDFAPPPDAVLTPRRVNISGGVAVGILSQKAPVEYPLDAKAGGVSGTVVLQIVIGKDGHVSEVKVISGPSPLQTAAVDSVRKWVYRPYLLNGEAVEVNTTVNVVFTLGR